MITEWGRVKVRVIVAPTVLNGHSSLQKKIVQNTFYILRFDFTIFKSVTVNSLVSAT